MTNLDRPSEARKQLRLIVPSLSAGGNERDCVQLCNGFVGMGCDVELLVARAAGPFRERLDARVKISDCGARRLRYALIPFWRRLRQRPRVPTLVFDFDTAVGLGISQWLAVRGRLPIVYREGSSPFHNIPRSSLWKYRAFVARHRGVIAQSEEARSQLVRLGLGRLPMTVIPNPYRAPDSAPSRQPKRSGSGMFVLAVGRLTPEKGFERLIRGFSNLLKHRANSHLAILGDGPLRPRLEALAGELGIAQQVSLPGFQKDVPSWHARADVFVLSSHYEGQSNALMEAVAACCPSICAACEGGQKEFMRQCGLERFLVPTESFESGWADCALAAARAPEKTWHDARQRLLAWADPARVGRAYLDFLLNPRNLQGRETEGA